MQIVVGLLAEMEGLEPPAVLPVTLFESAQPAYSPHFRNHLAERDERMIGLYRIGVSFHKGGARRRLQAITTRAVSSAAAHKT